MLMVAPFVLLLGVPFLLEDLWCDSECVAEQEALRWAEQEAHLFRQFLACDETRQEMIEAALESGRSIDEITGVSDCEGVIYGPSR